MRRPLTSGVLAALALSLALAATVNAAEPMPRSPLAVVSDKSDVVIEIPNPKLALETGLNHELFKALQEFPNVKETLNSTGYRRFYQLVAYFEKELGSQWPELLDKLAGGGVVIAVQSNGFQDNKAPALFVIQGKDEAVMKKAFPLGLQVIEQELARQEKPITPKKGKHQGIETIELNPETHAALAGSTLLIANQAEVLHAAIDLHTGKAKKSIADNKSLQDSRKLLPPNPLARVWVDWEPVRKSPVAADIYKTPRDPALTVLFGGYVDCLSRTPYVAASVHQDKDGFLATIRMPVGRDGMGIDEALHLAPRDKPGIRPVLEPRNVLYADSFYLDISRIWEDREKLFGGDRAKDLEKFDKDSGAFLSGLQFSKLAKASGPYHRIVAVNQATGGYKRQPKQAIPAFAVISELREPEEFARGMNTVLRGAALAATASNPQLKLKLQEEEYKGVKVVGYRFDEAADVKEDVNDIRFAFSPCFCLVGNQYVWCSTMELCRELIDLLQAEQKNPPKLVDAGKNRSRLYGEGFAGVAEAFQDTLVAQAVLDQAIAPDEAKQQIKSALGLLRKLGTLEGSATFTDKEFRYDIRLKAK